LGGRGGKLPRVTKLLLTDHGKQPCIKTNVSVFNTHIDEDTGEMATVLT